VDAILVLLIAALLSYLVGSIPTSYIMARLLKGVDIRAHGSGNVGATNVFRVVGKLPALVTLIIDIAKGVFVVTVLASLAHEFAKSIDYEFTRILLGFSAIAGHIWTVFLKFKGGKGVATTIGVLAVIAPQIFFPSLAVWLIIFSFTNYVSLASIGFGISLALMSAIFSSSLFMTIFAVTLCFINTYKHKENIRRLIRHGEPKTHILRKGVNI
jgi:glycerol-3-phosphate acyltransferase PlsY